MKLWTANLDLENRTMNVVKRDGRSVRFDEDKIFQALKKASDKISPWSEAQQERIESVTDRVISEIFNRFHENVKIYEIQNIVEHELLEAEEIALAEEYVSYRTKRDFERKKATDINFTIEKLIQRDSTVVNENANKDSNVFNTQRDLTAGAVSKAIGLKMLPPHVANAHQKGDIHYHDLDYSPFTTMSNCCLIDFKNMFEKGFKLGNAQVDSPKSIQTATAQASQIIANVASSQYGGCSFDRADEVLAPYAKLNYAKHKRDADKWIETPEKREEYAKEKTAKDIYDAMQSLEYEINTLFTSNGQTPFVTVGFGLGTDWYAREIQKAMLKVRIKGLGSEHRTAIFPKLIFTLKRGLNLEVGTPNYDIKQLALECSTKRMYPDILSYDKIVELTGSFKASMGCRSFLQGWKDAQGNEVTAGRNNLGVVTVNLPRIALESRDSNGKAQFDKFWAIFNERISIAKDALLFRVERVKEAQPKNAPILFMNGALGRLKEQDSVDELYKNERATVSLGYIGLYEVATTFFGPIWENNPEAKAFTIEIVKRMHEDCEEWSKATGYHFSVYSTPSESLTDRFCRMDKEKFGSIPDITEKDYYTNSFHYDIRKNPTPFEKLDFEKDYPVYANGGFIHYCEYPMIQQNPKALEAVWDYAYDRIGYLGTNAPIDHCYACGFEGDFAPTEKGFKCPQCGNADPKTCDVVKRTCGYLGNPQARPMVHGRHSEISHRVKHMNGLVGSLANGQNIDSVLVDEKKSEYFVER
ncbi:anaerobic ribonucleoside-triphosphate reductase [Lactococcus fujiensis]|uniref:Anaerobic ribonucleoside triphosphate reductase n=1 Tax=Lactococcus fujiensis JCM 16395 TaxID=1291764 RepID=A0A2A5RKV3_9LACT|nr:anaerobic ribonucleoside-triphosphate reductase [Lactococcus fujiensis]PCR99850.1 anaerobic ribonucleoside triphosphate reductase [Lactococcus fujiensis JCM 16395]